MATVLLVAACGPKKSGETESVTLRGPGSAAAASTPAAAPSTPAGASAMPRTACQAGEISAYLDEPRQTPICGHPCTKDADCAMGQECSVAALKSNEPTMGMAAAVANGMFLCGAKRVRPTSSATPHP